MQDTVVGKYRGYRQIMSMDASAGLSVLGIVKYFMQDTICR